MSFRERFKTSVTWKIISILFLVAILLVPKFMIEDLINERKNRQFEVINEISQSWGSPLTITGPFLVVPYTEVIERNGKEETVKRTAKFSPEQLLVAGDLPHTIRQRSIFKAVLFNGVFELSGSFKPNIAALDLQPDQMLWEQTEVVLGLSALNGIKNVIQLKLGDETIRMEPGGAGLINNLSGVVAKTSYSPDQAEMSFQLPLKINGSQHFMVSPVGRFTEVKVQSDWGSPSFTGQFLPDEREVNDSGFTAQWQILDFNRNLPQQWTTDVVYFGASDFGVKLLQPVDQYSKNDRTIKYAILLIGLTFMIFFFYETLKQVLIHPIQYLLIGLSICVFFLLLLSLCEHIGFNGAYLAGAAATIGLIGAYSRTFLPNRAAVFTLVFMLAGIYGFIFTILQLEDYALLAGSIGVFIVLATAMYFSRKVDWYNLSKDNDEIGD